MSGLGNKIKYLREHKNYTQKRVADAINVSNVQLSRYETGDRQPDYETLKKLADFFEVSTDYLLGRTEKSIAENIDEPYDSLAEIYKIADRLGMERLGFFDVEEWKNLGPEEVAQIEQHFEFMVQHAKMKKEQKAKKEK